MTLEAAQRAFYQQRSLAVGELRKPYTAAVAKAEGNFNLPRPKRPMGLLRWLLRGDFERVHADWNARKARLIWAKARLLEFEAEIADRQSHLQRTINLLTREGCNRSDPAILAALENEQRRKAEEKQFADALRALNAKSGESHTLLRPNASKTKWGGTLFDKVDIAGRAFARATEDRGYSFVLFPWSDNMQAHCGRPCWFWFNGFGEPHFTPQLGARPALPPNSSNGSAPGSSHALGSSDTANT